MFTCLSTLQNPELTVPLLEMVAVEVPLNTADAIELCWSFDRFPSEDVVEATMEVIRLSNVSALVLQAF